MSPRNSSSVRWKRVAAAGAVVALAFAASVVPIPLLYAFLPGPVRDVGRLVDISDASTYSSEGKFLLTTVSVDTQVTLAEWVAAALDPDKVIVLKSEVAPPGVTLDELEEQQRDEMTDSKQHAQEVALVALGYDPPTGDGAQVEETIPGKPADGRLQPGDVIVSIDGVPVETTCDVGAGVARHRVGEKVGIGVRRDGRLQRFDLATAANPDDPGESFLGVAMSDVGYHFEPGVDVAFETGRIAGPSAGLMFTLALYDRLTADDLTAGGSIAGTGTIDCDGGIGPIGGVEQKVAGAERQGAGIFLAPQANAEAARRAADELDVVAVSTFAEAVDYLENLE